MWASRAAVEDLRAALLRYEQAAVVKDWAAAEEALISVTMLGG
jgi:hypothetical protein